MAGIDKRDERGRTVDIHALRHTFETWLSKGGVAPRVAQEAMRHSTIDLTMNAYIDPKLLDVHGALETIPAVPLDGGHQFTGQRAKATGTDDLPRSQFVLLFAPTSEFSGQTGSFPAKSAPRPEYRTEPSGHDISEVTVKRNNPLTVAVNGLHDVERRGVEPPTSALRTQRSPN
jgi:hypothetical protein